MRIYLAGPMTGLPENNYPAFNEAAKKLRDLGCEVASPAEIEPPEKLSWEEWMKRSIQMMLSCTHVVLLPDWHKSTGARLEQNLAAQLRMPCKTLEQILNLNKGKQND